jgi:hypothetical protein
VTAVNTSLAVYDRTGAAVLGPDPLRSLFPLASGTNVFDPKVVYDQYRASFVVAFLARNDARDKSWILVIAIRCDRGRHRHVVRAQIEGDRTSGMARSSPTIRVWATTAITWW